MLEMQLRPQSSCWLDGKGAQSYDTCQSHFEHPSAIKQASQSHLLRVQIAVPT